MFAPQRIDLEPQLVGTSWLGFYNSFTKIEGLDEIDGSPNTHAPYVDLTGKEVKMQFKKFPSDYEAALILSSPNGEIVIDAGTQGAFLVKKKVLNLKPGLWYFDVQITLGPDDVYVIIVGRLEIYASTIEE